MSFLTEVDGEYQVKDKEAFVNFVVDYGAEYPASRSLLQINEEALTKHYEETGKIPPGVKLVKTTIEEGSNVICLDIVHGSKSSDS